MTEAGEAQARRVEAEAAAWTIPDLLSLDRATLDELPVLDLANLRKGKEGAVEQLAVQLRKVFKQTGFFMISNHGCEEEVEATMEASRRFHTELSQDQKEAMAFGSRGVGYLKINSRLLPKREKGNMNEAFIVKQEPGPRNITLDSNPFPKESSLPGFKGQVNKFSGCTCAVNESVNTATAESESSFRCFVMPLQWSLLPSPYFQSLPRRSTSTRTFLRQLSSRQCSDSVCLTIPRLALVPTSMASLLIQTLAFSPYWLRLVHFLPFSFICVRHGT